MGLSTAGVSPEALPFLAKTYASRRVSAWTAATLHEWAQAMADHAAAVGADAVPTDPEWNLTPTGSRDVRYRKACDRRFWERKGKKILRRAQSNADLLAKNVGFGTAHNYSGASADVWGKHCRDAADAYLAAAMVYNHATGFAIPLKDVAQTAETRSAKIYAVLSAMQVIAARVDGGVEWAMLTVTAPSRYHANPTPKKRMGRNKTKRKTNVVWSPADDAAAAARYVQDGWERMRAQLAKSKIRVTGIRVEEPHKDGTPHYHLVFYYPTGTADKVKSAVLTQFPAGLRVRTAYSNAGKLKFATPRVYTSLAAFLEGRGVKDRNNRIRAQCQFDIGAKGASAASFASYATKYVAKYLCANDEKSPELLKIEQHRQTYSIRAIAFFGLPSGALTSWDLLRKIQLAPRGENDKKWVNPKAIAPRLTKFAKICQHENAEGKSNGMSRFVNLLGGLTIAPTLNKYNVKPVYAPTITRYGESGSRIVGVALLQRTPGGKKDTWTEVERYEFKANDNEILPTLAADAVRATYKRAESGEGTGFGIRAECAAASGRLVQLKISVTSGLTLEQQAAVTSPIGKDIWVTAAAASGKTTLMAARVAHLVKNDVPQSMIWCLSHTNEAAANLAARLPAGCERVQTATIHSFACQTGGFDIAGGVNYDEMLTKSIEFAPVVPLAYRRYVLVDEAQDLSALQWAWIRAWSGQIFAVGDDRQAIYQSLGSIGMSNAAELRNVPPIEHLLSVNHRSAAEIVTFANAIAIDTAPSFATRGGGQITVTKLAKTADEMAEILEWASATPSEAIKTRAILVRTRAERARIVCELSMLVETCSAASNVKVMTVHSSKGLEFDAVLIACGQRKPCELEPDARNVWYVAVTRAREQLHITSVGELPEILCLAVEATSGRKP
jgi:hypothetical protein